MISMMEKSYKQYELDQLEVKANRLAYKVGNQLGDNAFKLLLVKTELDVFGKISDYTRKLIGE